MEDHTIERIEKDGYTARLMPDYDPIDPRKDYDNLATFVCDHRSYELGDTTLLELTGFDLDDFRLAARVNPRDLIERYVRMRFGAVAFTWLSLLDHSGLHMYAGSREHWCDPGGWDSGTVGFAFVGREEFAKEYADHGGDTPENREAAQRVMMGELETYDQYLTGDVCSYVIEDEDGDHVDSCYGFFGGDYARQEMQEALEAALEHKEEVRGHKRIARLARIVSELEEMAGEVEGENRMEAVRLRIQADLIGRTRRSLERAQPDTVEYITGAGRGDDTYIKVYRSGRREEFKSEVYPNH